MKPWIRDRLRALASASRLGERSEAEPRDARPAEPAGKPGERPDTSRAEAPARRRDPVS